MVDYPIDNFIFLYISNYHIIKDLKKMDTQKLSKVMKALSNPNRLKLYLEIAKKSESGYETDECDCYISSIMNKLKIGAPTISHHLKELSNADLIITERKGKLLVARVNEKTVKNVNDLLALKK
jgi:ArsR family transcriptional regulator